MPNAGSFTYWYLQLPSVLLLAMIVLLLVRLAASLVVRDGAAIMQPVIAVTRPVVAGVGALTPRIVPTAGVILCAIIWLSAVRIVIFMVAVAIGVRL